MIVVLNGLRLRRTPKRFESVTRGSAVKLSPIRVGSRLRPRAVEDGQHDLEAEVAKSGLASEGTQDGALRHGLQALPDRLA